MIIRHTLSCASITHLIESLPHGYYEDDSTSLTKSEGSATDNSITTTTSSAPREPFPYLNTSGLSAKEKEILFEKLLEESVRIRLSFISLLADTEASLRNRRIQTSKIHEDLKSSDLHPHNRIAGLTTIQAIMGQLKEYLNFLDFGLLERIVQKFGTQGDHAGLHAYKQRLAEFAQQRVFECPEGMFGNACVGDDEEVVKVRGIDTKTSLHDLTLSQVQMFASILRRELDCDLRLTSCRREEGSLELGFGVLSSAARSVFPLSEERRRKLVSLGVWQVTCGDYIFRETEHWVHM